MNIWVDIDHCHSTDIWLHNMQCISIRRVLQYGRFVMFFQFQNEEKTKPPAVTNFWKNMCGGGGEFFPFFILVLIFPSFVSFPNIFCGAFYFTGILTMIILLKVVLIGHGPTVSLVKALHRESPIVNSTPKVETLRKAMKNNIENYFQYRHRTD